jgi:hypothetical protein
VAIADEGNTSTAGDTGVSTVAHLWLVPGTGVDAQLDAAAASFSVLPETTAFTTRCAVWVAGNLDSGPGSEIVGIDNGIDGNNCFGFGGSPAPRLALVRSVGGSMDTTIYELPTDARAVASVELHDLDSDGDLDVLALFKGEVRANVTGDQPIEGAAVLVIWNVDGELSLSNITRLAFAQGQRYFDVAPIRIDDTNVPALAILATAGVYVAVLDTADATYSAPTRVLPQAGDGKLEVADLNGDGLDDLAYTVGDDVHVVLAREALRVGATDGQPPTEPASQGGDQ